MSRITHTMSSQTILHDLQTASGRLDETRRKLSSGRELTRPSDDPLATNRALTLRADLEGTRQYQRNVKDGLGWQTVTDVALSKIGEMSQRARELVIQAASDATSGDARKAIATEIDQLIDGVKQEANISFAGRYVFAGTATTTRPYATATTNDTYSGNASPIAREIGPGVGVQVNSIAADMLGNGPGAGDNKLLHVLRDIATHLRADDGSSLRGTDLVRLDDNMDEIARHRAVVGATSNRLESASSRLLELEESAQGLLSETEDADMAKAMVDFSIQQSVYQAALKSGANIVQASLLDFLR